MKNKIKVGLVTLLIVTNVHGTGIPVVDVAGGIINKLGFSAQLTKTATQIANWETQYEQMKEDYEAISGIREAAALYSDLEGLIEVMDEFKVGFADLDLKNPKSQIGALAKEIFDKNKIFANCAVDYLSDLQKSTCENDQARNVEDIAVSIMYTKELEKTMGRIESLGEKLAKSEDTKESQDISNAIAIELAQIEVSNAKVKMMEHANIARKKADKDRLDQEKAMNIGKMSDTSSWF